MHQDPNAQAIAIRLPAINAGPEELKRSHPIVIFSEQGLDAAGLRSLPGAFDGPSMPRRPSPRFAIEEVVVVFDRSESMSEQATPSRNTVKLEHARQIVAKLKDDLFPDARVSLVTFNTGEQLVDLQPKASVEAVTRALRTLKPDGSTDFVPALARAESIVKEAAPEARKLVLFFTDGNNHGSHERAEDLARSIGGTNTAVYVVGIGADYNLHHLFDLAGAFGDAAWEHTPNPDPSKQFGPLLAEFIHDLRAQEYFLEVHASGDITGLFSVTPTTRRASDGVAFVGYHAEGITLCFSRDSDPSLRLAVKAHRNDLHGKELEIPILDIDQAAAHFEKLGLAKQSVAPVLLLLSQLKGDKQEMQALAKEHPSIAALVDAICAELDDHSVESRLNFRAGASALSASMSSISRVSRVRVNALSAVPVPKRGRPRPGDPYLHSGGVGRLDDAVPSSIPPLGQPDPAAYDKAVPAPAPLRGGVMRIFHNGTEQGFDLQRIKNGDHVTIGSGWPASIKIPDADLSRRHFRIERSADGLFATNLKPHKPCYLNGEVAPRRFKLKDGDEIKIGEIVIRFTRSV